MGGGAQYGNPFDIFEQFFGGSAGFGGSGGASRARAPQEGNDERYDMVIDFQQAVFGCRSVIRSKLETSLEQTSASFDFACSIRVWPSHTLSVLRSILLAVSSISHTSHDLFSYVTKLL